MAGTREMSLDQYTKVQAVIKQSAGTQSQEKSMSTRVFNDRTRSIPDDDDDNNSDGQPRTLGAAKELLIKSQERVSFLQKELAQARAGKPASKFPPTLTTSAAETVQFREPPAAPPVTSARPPATKANGCGQPCGRPFDPADSETWDGYNRSVIPFPDGCDSPATIGAHLSTVSSERLPWYLESAPKSPTAQLQKQMVWNELQARKGK
jgi:hypothetical protein